MKQRLALVISAAALVVALLGATSLGEAATNTATATVNKARSTRLAGPVRIKASNQLRGPRGPRGKRGPRGPVGPGGPQGTAGIASIVSVDGAAAYQCAYGGGSCQVATSTAYCPAGSYVVGGGFNASTPDNVVAYARRVTTTSYGVIAVNFWPTPGTISAHAVCASGAGIQPLGIESGSPSEMAAKLAQLRSMVPNG